ncbi:MAG: dihydroneopterin aldolase [Dysgonamonadaceae bacterium]|jgi:dihydroneopterin aldolase|nr:dihydroneopterin aldolase [Dysgonamonadaceae bacterium]
MQYIELKGMIFYAYHGVMEQERKVGNTFTVDLKLHADLSEAIQTDRLENTINYAEVYNIVKEELAIPSQLLEHLAGRVVKHLKQKFPVIISAEIRLAKLNPPVLGGDMKEAAVVMKL